MTYNYEILSGPHTGTVIEIEQKITDPRLETLVHEGETVSVKRVIAGGTGFILRGGCWSRDRFEKGIQSHWKDPGDP